MSGFLNVQVNNLYLHKGEEMLKENKIAVFFDCENVSVKHLQNIYDSLTLKGEIMIAKAYCDWGDSVHKPWRDALSSFAIEAIQVLPNVAHKNAADIKLVIDVMKTICTSTVDSIVIVSSDSDFTALAMEVKANNFEVIGIGEKKTPESLRSAYSSFIQLPSIVIQKKFDHKVISEIVKIITNFKGKDKDGFMEVSQIGIYLENNPLIKTSKEYGSKTWGHFIKMNSDIFILKMGGRRNSTLFVKYR